MKKLLLMAIALIACLNIHADDFDLYIVSTSNTTTNYPVSTVRKLTFDKANVVVTRTDGTTITVAMDDIARMYLDTATEVDAIERTAADNAAIAWDGQQLTVNGTADRIHVYQAGGTLVMQQSATNNATLSLAHMPQGVYIVTVDGKSFKIVKN